jgi:hypothetical protein
MERIILPVSENPTIWWSFLAKRKQIRNGEKPVLGLLYFWPGYYSKLFKGCPEWTLELYTNYDRLFAIDEVGFEVIDF